MVIRPSRESAQGWTRRPRWHEPQFASTEWTRLGTECFLAPGRPGGGRGPEGGVAAVPRPIGLAPGPVAPRWNQMGDWTDRLPWRGGQHPNKTEM